MRREVINIHPDGDAFDRAVAARVATLIVERLAAAPRCRVALAGGHTPTAIYRALASPALAARIDWQRVDLLLGDERWVAPDDPASNARMVRETLLSRLASPPRLLAPDWSLGDAERAAAAYARRLRDELGALPGRPWLDLALLGLGGDGHTASLFPESAILDERERLVAAVHLAPPGGDRISLTLPALNGAGHVLIVVRGADKAAIVATALAATDDALPIKRVAPRSAPEWHLDRAAAAALGERDGAARPAP